MWCRRSNRTAPASSAPTSTRKACSSGTDLDWFRRLRAATPLEITAAGGITTLDEVRALLDMGVHAALGMAIYTGRLSLSELAALA